MGVGLRMDSIDMSTPIFRESRFVPTNKLNQLYVFCSHNHSSDVCDTLRMYCRGLCWICYNLDVHAYNLKENNTDRSALYRCSGISFFYTCTCKWIYRGHNKCKVCGLYVMLTFHWLKGKTLTYRVVQLQFQTEATTFGEDQRSVWKNHLCMFFHPWIILSPKGKSE